ncbi:MAG: hypothetical protein ACRED5_00675 [Propylenella sp.]
MAHRRLLRATVTALVLAGTPAVASAEDGVCRPKKIVRYLDVDLSVLPASGPADQAVTLSARCLPADRPVIVWSGQSFDDVRPVATGSIDSAGRFGADATVPADAEPGEKYFFAIMIDDHIVGTGAFEVDKPAEPAAR